MTQLLKPRSSRFMEDIHDYSHTPERRRNRSQGLGSSRTFPGNNRGLPHPIFAHPENCGPSRGKRKGPCLVPQYILSGPSSFPQCHICAALHTEELLQIGNLHFSQCLRPVFFKGQYPLSYAMVGVIPKNGRKGPLPRAQHPVWADSNSAMVIR